MKTYTIALPDEFAEFVDRVLAAGQWDTVENLVTAGLMAVQDQMARDAEVDKDWLRKEIQKGIDQVDRGEVRDGPTVMARIRERLRKL